MDEDKIPWPEEGDLPFDDGADWWYNACLNFGADPWLAYPDGYKLAGDIVVERILQEPHHQDYLVFPIAFLYRHYIELRLKELIVNGNKLIGSTKDFPMTHNLVQLWTACRSVFRSIWEGESTTDLDVVETCIKQFSALDPYSTAFRYPIDKHNNQSLPGIKTVNLRNLKDVVDRLSGLLDAASTGILGRNLLLPLHK